MIQMTEKKLGDLHQLHSRHGNLHGLATKVRKFVGSDRKDDPADCFESLETSSWDYRWMKIEAG
jgi:hypothetical protein